MKLSLILMVASLGLASCQNQGTTGQEEHVVRYYSSGSLQCIVEVRNGTPNGKSLWFYENGSKEFEYNFRNGKKEGIQLEYRSDRLFSAQVYSDGKLNGWGRYYSPSTGCLVSEGFWKNDMRDGLWYEYYESRLLEVDKYSNDSLVAMVYRSSEFPNPEEILPISNKKCLCALPVLNCD